MPALRKRAAIRGWKPGCAASCRYRAELKWTPTTITRVADSGSCVTPDMTADFCGVALQQVGPDRVAVSVAHGKGLGTALLELEH